MKCRKLLDFGPRPTGRGRARPDQTCTTRRRQSARPASTGTLEQLLERQRELISEYFNDPGSLDPPPSDLAAVRPAAVRPAAVRPGRAAGPVRLRHGGEPGQPARRAARRLASRRARWAERGRGPRARGGERDEPSPRAEARGGLWTEERRPMDEGGADEGRDRLRARGGERDQQSGAASERRHRGSRLRRGGIAARP